MGLLLIASGLIWDEMSWAIGVGIGVMVVEILTWAGLIIALPSIFGLF
ncbi:MAG: hypothetical protein BWX80_03546 [Candidatus Hydrogenedentes bacterium ADurb.Bin101]|jgi:hypothetical protein|nr:hypothetical protein [Candidatus Hydrogenedentota bacterium]OQB99857.1 MAG: hypothetical protein BWX80_03546 [Candidatus Hydrogenedentes bacterium ADurb.Bin101]HOC67788.1 hypothetical protein [Candidatus Hydrogenedentota bacterium]HOH31330.1 hypothetical protein [Candidatus Hydrogenedentota bacterium]